MAFFYSSKIDTTTLEKCFIAIKAECGIIKTRAFMSDDYQAYYNAWSNVMGNPGNKLLCSWHVMKSWSRHFNLVNGSLTKQLKSRLLDVMKELDEKTFEVEFSRMRTWLTSTRELKKFGSYFLSTYEDRKNEWAYCYRKFLGINTNNHLEAMHR